LTLKTRPYLPESLFDLVECAIHGAYLRFGDQYVTHIRSENPMGWMVHRESFDEAHLQMARAHPTVEVWEGVAVRDVVEHASGVVVDTTQGSVEASLLVGADGATSVVSRALPGHEDRHMGFAYEGEVDREPDTGPRRPASREETLFDFRTFPHGYGWIFPKRDHHSVGGFVCGEKLPEIKEVYREFLSGSAWLQGVETNRTKGHPTSLGGSMRRLNSRRILLVGEAAGLVDPLTGEGIYYALRSGHLAGLAIGRLLKGAGSHKQ
jgi:flavin-dependent dehydrogenase